MALVGRAYALQTKVVGTSPRAASVQPFKGLADAQKTADGVCAKLGRFAQWVYDGGYLYLENGVLTSTQNQKAKFVNSSHDA